MIWNFTNGRPIYWQIVEHMKLFIVSGELSAGQKLPAVRDLAFEAGVNPNTMQRAFLELEHMGLTVTNRTAGRFVTDDQAAIEAVRNEIAGKSVGDFLGKMKQLGYSLDDTFELIRNYKGVISDE